MAAEKPASDFQDAASRLLERFKHLWEVRDETLISQIVAADAVSHWSGRGPVAGHQYPSVWGSLIRVEGLDIDFTVTGHAAQEPYLYISWHVRASAGSDTAEFDGVDRFRLRGETADEVYVVFDTAPVAALMQRAGRRTS